MLGPSTFRDQTILVTTLPYMKNFLKAIAAKLSTFFTADLSIPPYPLTWDEWAGEDLKER